MKKAATKRIPIGVNHDISMVNHVPQTSTTGQVPTHPPITKQKIIKPRAPSVDRSRLGPHPPQRLFRKQRLTSADLAIDNDTPSHNVSFQDTTSHQRSSQVDSDKRRTKKIVLPDINKPNLNNPKEREAVRRTPVFDLARQPAYKKFSKKLATESASGEVESTAQKMQMIKLGGLSAADPPEPLHPRRNRNRNRSVDFEEHPDEGRGVTLSTVQEAAGTGNWAPSQSRKSKILEEEPFEDFLANIKPLRGPYAMDVTKEHLNALDTYIFAIDNRRNTVTNEYLSNEWSTLVKGLSRMPTVEHYEELVKARRKQLETIHGAWEKMIGFKYEEEYHPNRPYNEKNSVTYMRNMIKRYHQSGQPFTQYQKDQLWRQRTNRRLPLYMKGILNGQPAEVILREAMAKPEWNKEKETI